MSYHIEMKEFEEYENLGFEFTYSRSNDYNAEEAPSADEVFEVKYRVPSFVLRPEVFQNISSMTMEDEIYDDATSFGKNTIFHRLRKIHCEQDRLIYSVKQQHHRYYKVPCCEIPKKLVLSYRFTRKEITEETVRVYLDQVYFPVRYEVVSFSSRRKMQNANMKEQITDIVNAFMRVSRQKYEEGRGTTSLLSYHSLPDLSSLFYNYHFLPLFTKFMYVLQCVDADPYREVYQRHDRLSEFVHKRAEESIENNSSQNDPLLKRYLWSVCIYPCNVYSKLNIGNTFSETLTLNKEKGFAEIMEEMDIEGDYFHNSSTAGIDIWDNE
jgi:hypothetical protein